MSLKNAPIPPPPPPYLNKYEAKVWNDIESGDYKFKLRCCTRLHIAVAEECPNLVDYFIARGDNVNKRDSSNCTPLILLIKNGFASKQIFMSLTSAGARINIPGCPEKNMPLIKFLKKKDIDTDLLRIYLEAGASAVDRGANKRPMECALEQYDWAAAGILKQYGAKNDETSVYHIKSLECTLIVTDLIRDLGWPSDQDRDMWKLAFDRDSEPESMIVLWLAGIDLWTAQDVLSEARNEDHSDSYSDISAQWHECEIISELLSGSFTDKLRRNIKFHALRCIVRVDGDAPEICFALQSLNLPALLTQTILQELYCSTWPNIPDHVYWDLVTKIKHFHDPPEHPGKRRRVFAGLKRN